MGVKAKYRYVGWVLSVLLDFRRSWQGGRVLCWLDQRKVVPRRFGPGGLAVTWAD